MTAPDAVDRSFRRRESAMKGAADQISLIRRSQHEVAQHDHDHGSRHREVGLQVHGIDAAGQVVVRQQLKRGRVMRFFTKVAPCTIGIEACASSHHWARELTALGAYG